MKYIGQKIVLIPPLQTLSISLDQHVLILLARNVYNGNIGTFWYRALCMKTWCSSKSLPILSNFLIYFLGPKFFDTIRLKYFDTSKLKCIESFCE